MLKYCYKKWHENSKLLEYELKRRSTLNECEYVDLVKLVVEFILNPGGEYKWDLKHITVVDNGDYQGTQLFLIPQTRYQPAEYEYLMTYVGYGSCSGCDTLLAIQNYEYGKPLTERQLKDFMALCKDLVTNMIRPYNCGWREDEDFVEITV